MPFGCIRVFSSLYTPDDEILVGYKGTSGETDTGYVHCPYVPMLVSGVVVDSETFQPIVSLMTRYGTVVNADDIPDPSDISGVGTMQDVKQAANYYHLIKIDSDVLVTKKESSDEDSQDES